jgi:signal transduction histidine kinase
MQHPFVGYLAAFLLQLLAIGLDILLVQVFGEFALPGVPVTLVIVFVGLTWGAAPSLLAMLVGMTLLDYAVLPPRFVLDMPDLPDALEVLLLLLLGFLITFTASQRERALQRAEELAALLRQEHARSERERLRLQQVLEVLPTGVHLTDLSGRLLEMNAAMRALWEQETPPVGQSFRSLAKGWWPAAGQPASGSQGAMTHALQTGEAYLGQEVEIETQGGQRKTILHSAAPIRDESGVIVGGVVADMDITERKHLEDALREANRQMDAFLGMAVHELKTPLTILHLQIQVANRHFQRLTSTEAGAPAEPVPLEQMEQQVRRLERLVNDLLDVSRIRAGKLELSLAPVELAALVQECVEEQRQATPSRTIRLHLPTGQPVSLAADADRIGQVLTNYLTNALKYSPAEQPVEVGLTVEGQQACVWVQDAGPGIPVAEQERIWERFHRVQSIQVQSGTGVGLGLGLSICREIIERHHGQVGVQSAPGHGSTFWFSLPLASAAMSSQSA